MNATNTCPERLSAIIPPPASLRTHRTATRTLSTSTPATVPAAGPKAAPDIPRVEPGPSRSGRGRRLFFRCVRLALAGGVLVGAGLHALHTFTSVTSEQAYVNAEMTVLRSPIDGEL